MRIGGVSTRILSAVRRDQKLAQGKALGRLQQAVKRRRRGTVQSPLSRADMVVSKHAARVCKVSRFTILFPHSISEMWPRSTASLKASRFALVAANSFVNLIWASPRQAR